MRETKFYEYLSSAFLESSQVYQVDNQWHNTRPSYDAPIRGPPVRGGGLAGSIIAWRVEGGREILLENVLNHTVLRIVLPSLLSCVPVIRTRGTPEKLAVLASFQTQSGCQLVRIHCDFPSSEHSNEPVRVESLQGAVDDDIVSVLHSSDDGTYFFGLVTGQCGRVVEHYDPQPSLMLERFELPNDDDNISSSSDTSRRSASMSTTSQSFITRLFNNPRNILTTPTANAGTRAPMYFETPSLRTARGSLMSLATPLSSRRQATNEPPRGDSVEALCALAQNEPCLVALHASGRICAYFIHSGKYAGDENLGLTLAKDFSRQFLLKSSEEHIVAVVTVDEDPQANSVRVFSINLKRQVNRSLDVTCSQLVKRGGPIDRVIGAVLLGNDVVVATEAGVISGPMNGPHAHTNGIGLPPCNLWTVVDDIEQSTGFGHAVNAMVENSRERILAAHRFSSVVLSKAMRLSDLPNTSREVVEKHIRDSRFTEDEVPLYLKALSRAEFLAIDTDMPLRGIQIVDGVGLVASRNSGLFVFRNLMQEEHVALGRNIRAFTEADMLSGPVACLAASHAISQILCSKLSRTMKTDQSYENLLFMMQLSLRFSEVTKHLALTYRIAQQRAMHVYTSQIQIDASVKPFQSAVDYVQSVLAPGGKSIMFLNDANEMLALQLCATHSASFVPISSFFASGLAWLSQYISNKNSVNNVGAEQMTNGEMSFRDDNSDVKPDFNGFLHQSYGCLVSAAQVASSSDGLTEEDRDCALHLAKILRTVQSENDNGDMQIDTQVDTALGGVQKEEFVEHLGYWLLERSVRLFESAGSPKTAAAAALEAMKIAPSREYYETMRAAAFGRLLDARELQTALKTQLKPPFDPHNECVVSRGEASALRDGIGLFVNAVADEGQLKWLAEVELPEPLNSLASLTLERRARAAEPLDANAELESSKWSDVDEEFRTRKIYEYEYLYAWHLGNYNAAAAAASALEWGERLSNEGLSIVVSTSFNNTGITENESRLRLLLAWAGMKVRAFSCALAVVQTMEPNKQYFARTKFSILAQDPQDQLPGVITPDWVSRRQLLAHAQRLCITRMLSDSNIQRVVSQLNFLSAHGSQYLQGTEQGINWIIKMLCDVPSPENIQLAAELAAAWIKENGDQQLALLVSSAAKLAANPAVEMFDYSHFSDLLIDVYNMAGVAGVNRNWSLLGLKSAITQLAGEFQIPQWLVDQAAWGLSQSNLDPAKISGITSWKGDVGSVARAFLEVGKPIDAAKVLLSEFQRFAILKESKKSEEMLYYYNRMVVPYAAIDATIIMLGRMDENDYNADMCLMQLKDETQKYSKLAVEEYRDVVVKYNANQESPVVC